MFASFRYFPPVADDAGAGAPGNEKGGSPGICGSVDGRSCGRFDGIPAGNPEGRGGKVLGMGGSELGSVNEGKGIGAGPPGFAGGRVVDVGVESSGIFVPVGGVGVAAGPIVIAPAEPPSSIGGSAGISIVTLRGSV